MSEMTDEEALALKDRATEFVDLAVSRDTDLRNVATIACMMAGIAIARYNPSNRRGISERFIRGLIGVVVSTFDVELVDLNSTPEPPPPR